jgi:hypothetical protein
MFVIWTKHGVHEVVENYLAGSEGKECVRKHVSALLRENLETQLRSELSEAAERMADDARGNINRKLNSIYSSHTQRLKQRISDLELQLEASTPEHQQRLETLEDKLREPERDLLEAIQQQKHAVTKDIKRTAAEAVMNMTAAARQIERRVEKLIETRLHEVMVDAAREHARSRPFDHNSLSNKQRAAAEGISLREVKRRRRAARSSSRQSGSTREPATGHGSIKASSRNWRAPRIPR